MYGRGDPRGRPGYGSADMNAENREQQKQHEQKLRPANGSAQDQVLHCANCDIEILWTPTVVRGVAYCCTGCAAGGPCSCDYSQYRSVTISGVIHYFPDAGSAGV